MSSLEDTLMDTEITEEITQEFETIAAQCITAVIDNVHDCFPQAHILIHRMCPGLPHPP